MGKALTILLFSVLTLQNAKTMQSDWFHHSIVSSFIPGQEDAEHSFPKIPMEDSATEGEAPVEESEDCHTTSPGSMPTLTVDSDAMRFSEPDFSPIPTPVLDELKPPPQA